MYLKEIRILGFKSFADKISINMNNDITCIVGPNGSGKSNIVDAVRWVLGEQSVKTLRGTNNMTDIIFSGSKKRNPLNLATVTLVFDNSDSFLKYPTNEIEVTRKSYRSGENEYYINNNQCRLKDITDLFMDSFIGKYSFNIISQGEVSRILSDSPIERRSLFEEASGVMKYRKRKEEALRKLDKTNENLTRVNDIIKELQTQIEPLKEQSNKAKKYLEYKSKLENIEIALTTEELTKLNKEYQQGQTTKEQLENEIIKENTNNTNNDLELEENKKQLASCEEQLLKTNKDYLSLSKEEEQLKSEKALLNERNKYLSNDMKVHENIKTLKEEQLSMNNQKQSLELDITTLNQNIQSLNEEITSYNNTANKINTEKLSLEQTINTKRKDLINLEYKIKSLKDYLESNQSSNPNVNRILNNPKLRGVHKTIGKIISCIDKYQLALNVSLASSKDFLVVDNESVAKNCINYLKENHLGRVTFFPLNVIKSKKIDEKTQDILKQQPGYINILSKLTEYDTLYKDIVENQIGNIILVDNLENANILSKRINQKYRIVTLEGDIIHVGGSITGGTIKNNSLINEKNEIESLETKKINLSNEIKNLEDNLSTSIKDYQDKQSTIISLEKQKILLEEQHQNKQLTLNTLKEEYNAKTQELTQLNSLLKDNFQQEEEKIMVKYYDILNKKQQLEKTIKDLQDKKQSLTSIKDNLEASYRYTLSCIRKYEENLKNCEINNTKISLKMDNLLNILNNDYQITYEKAKNEYILEIDYEEAKKQVNNLKSNIKSLGEVNIGAIEEFERLNNRYNFLNNQNNDLTEAVKTLLEIIDQLDKVMKEEFLKTFKEIEIEFQKVFETLFNGGTAKLQLTDKNDILNTGIDIIVTPPGKKLTTISLLSGGEKTLTAIALIFAILNIKKVPFCIFDEIEAALDETNVAKVGEYISRYVGKTQLIIITHKKKTMEYANVLYGITMQEDGVSKLVSVKLVENN